MKGIVSVAGDRDTGHYDTLARSGPVRRSGRGGYTKQRLDQTTSSLLTNTNALSAPSRTEAM